MILFLKFYNRKKFYFNFAKYLPLFVLVETKLMRADSVKESFISSILKGETKENLDKKSHEFLQKYWDEIMRPSALEFISKNKVNNAEGCMVTASLDIWTAPFAEKLGLELISTQAEFLDGKFTGKFSSPNCNGEEKVVRIKKFLEGKKFDKIIAFGDTSGDKPMLKFADESFFKYFH